MDGSRVHTLTIHLMPKFAFLVFFACELSARESTLSKGLGPTLLLSSACSLTCRSSIDPQ